MFEWLSDPAIWASFLTLTALEIVLGIDNIVFISVLVSKLPPDQARRARQIGLGLALAFRILFLLLLTWIIGLTAPVFDLGLQGGLDPVTGHPTFETQFTWKDLILLAGGIFLVYKATREIHHGVEGEEEALAGTRTPALFGAIVGQIIIIDIVFSIDSIITAVGMVDPELVGVMIAAVIVAVAVMFVASGPVAKFVHDNPTTKMLALAFLVMIGASLIADAFGYHIPRGYLYAAIAFSLAVEVLNVISTRNRKRRLPPGTGTGHGGPAH